MSAAAKPVAALKLFDWLVGQIDDDGLVEMGTRDIAHAANMGVSTVEHLFARWKHMGAVRSIRRGGPFACSIWRVDASMREAAIGCSAVHPSHIGRHATRGGARGNSGHATFATARGDSGGVEPPVRAPAPVRTRCPKCNLPPNHAECRHGWDGAMTRAMRRDAETLAAGELRRAAV